MIDPDAYLHPTDDEMISDAAATAGPPVPEVHVCESCDGGGWTATNFGDDDPNPERCPECDGKGRWTDEGGPDG